MNRLKNSFFVCLLFVVVFFISCNDAAKPSFYSLKIGKIEVIALQDASVEMNSGLVKNGDPAVVKKFMPDGKLPASVNVFLVKTGVHKILVDAGIGNGNAGKGMLIESLKLCGLNPEDIDIIFITHAHFDHVGGLVKDGKPVFTKAKLLFSKPEMATFSDEALRKLPAEVKGFYETANAAMKIYGKEVNTFKVGDTIAEGVKSFDISGHTPGHAGLMIESEGQKCLLFGDLLHISDLQFSNPDYSLVYDTDGVKAARTRNRILDMAASEKIHVAGVHITFPGMGSVVKSGNGYSFLPVK